MDVDVANKLNDHEMRIAALEDDDKKVHGFIAWIDSTVTNNPKLTLLFTAILTAVGSWVASRYFPNVPPSAPPANVKPADDGKKAETKWIEIPK